MIDGAWYKAAQLTVTPDKKYVFAAGGGGLWRGTLDASKGYAVTAWAPAVAGLNVTVMMPTASVNTNPTLPSDQLYFGNMDWSVVASTDELSTIAIRDPGTSKQKDAFDVFADDQTTNTAVIAVGNNIGKTEGPAEVFLTTDAGATWAPQELSTLGLSSTQRAMGIATRVYRGQRVILAAINKDAPGLGNGAGRMIRKVGDGDWKDVTDADGAMLAEQSGSRTVFVWPATPAWKDPNRFVVAFDRASGLYRSLDAGATWLRLWSIPPGAFGDLAFDPKVSSTLYVSVVRNPGGGWASDDSGVWRLENVASASVSRDFFNDPTRREKLGETTIEVPGPIAFDGSGASPRLYVAQGAPQTALFAIEDPATQTAASTNLVANDPVYLGTALFPVAMVVGSNGRVYVATSGNGIVRSEAP